MIETCLYCGQSGPLEGPGGELVPVGYPDFAHQRCLAAADDSLGIDALATAWLTFDALCKELPPCPHKNALRRAADIADRLSGLRSAVAQVIVELATGKFTAVDAARELRRALEDAAKGGDNG